MATSAGWPCRGSALTMRISRCAPGPWCWARPISANGPISAATIRCPAGARGGQTRNPYRLSHSPCGSSSGSAVAVAANLASVAIGTETDGSIVCPAAINGIVGLKPTVGLVSRDGIIPISFSQDTAGPMTRSVADAAAVLTAIAGRDDADPATATMPGRAVYDYTARLDPQGLRGKRIGLLQTPLLKYRGMPPLIEHAATELRRAGAVVVPVELPNQGAWADAERKVLLYEFKAGLERYFSAHRAPLHSLAELIDFNRAHSKQELGLFGQELLMEADATAGLADPAYIRARSDARRLAGPEGIDAALAAHQLDARSRRPPAWRGRSAAKATTSPARATVPPPSPAIPASACRWARSMACRSACCSWAPPGANRS